MDVPLGSPSSNSLFRLSGAGSRALRYPESAVLPAILILFVLLLLRVVLRRQWAAVAVSLLLWIAVATLTSDHPVIDLVFAALPFGVTLFVLIRFGLIASVFMFLFFRLSSSLVLLSHFPVWYAQPFVADLLAVAALTAYGFIISLAGRPIFREPILPA